MKDIQRELFPIFIERGKSYKSTIPFSSIETGRKGGMRNGEHGLARATGLNLMQVKTYGSWYLVRRPSDDWNGG